MSRILTADLMVANRGADSTDAPTGSLAIRYTERTAPTGVWPIGVSTLTAVTITVGVEA